MRHYFFLLLSLILIPVSFGQTPSASPSLTESHSLEKPRIETFGSSLKRYQRKDRRDSQAKPTRNESDDEIIRVQTDLVLNDVLVTDQKAKVITRLKKEDFIDSRHEVRRIVEGRAVGAG